ncbi:hypothetical protein CONLIGDRAFT_645782 [Coniochaeta ligniaria NRRL 30616]|uniref:CUE domain-containing protein n=1 Tax=Coniochaeta ligniaria NRRL 30616 TaxID=1408157 RepID=A0A1J7JIS6_9PEZI|nr:hypothetical protein CONLIGDRAFT_645782 [Coniochaeta ligniaria NRRL 30616]
MSAPVDTKQAKAATVEPVPESPTTARPLEMDDDDIQESGITLDDRTGATKEINTTAAASAGAPASSEAPPPKPPRPVSEQQQNEQMLKEAFPTIDASVIRAVLRASRGQVEPAFNALLEMTDPDAVKADEEQPPPPPPRPVAAPAGHSATPADQLEADELYARRLAEHYENSGAYEARTSSRGSAMPRGRQQTGLKPNELYDDREHSFLDDDFPVIKESLKKGFMETQTKVNSWFNTLKKKIDEQFDEGEEGQGGGQGSAFAGRPTRNQSRRSAEYDRYDADPEVLSDDFGGLKFNSDGTPIIPNQPSRANPNLFKPPPPSKSPKPNDGRRVAFNDSVEDIDAYNASPRIPPKDASPGPGSAGKTSKWQPLSMVDPSPVAENDPFSLGDSDDERETKDKTAATAATGAGKEAKTDDDAERLRKAAAEAMADSLVEDDKTKTKA